MDVTVARSIITLSTSHPYPSTLPHIYDGISLLLSPFLSEAGGSPRSTLPKFPLSSYSSLTIDSIFSILRIGGIDIDAYNGKIFYIVGNNGDNDDYNDSTNKMTTPLRSTINIIVNMSMYASKISSSTPSSTSAKDYATLLASKLTVSSLCDWYESINEGTKNLCKFTKASYELR